MYFFTFCNYINRISTNDLEDALYMLLSSMKKFIPKYELICFINYKVNFQRFKDFNVKFAKYYNDNSLSFYNNNTGPGLWLNMSFNKLNIYKDLYDNTGNNYIWVDLDTLITYDISYLDKLDNFFLPNGGNSQKNNPIFINSDITIHRKNYIQGNFWKINDKLYDDLKNTLIYIRNKGLILRYDAQDLFNYHIYFRTQNYLEKYNILGVNYNDNLLGGLTIWSKEGDAHPNIDGLINLYRENNVLKSKYYPDKDIHFLSFTFYRLRELIHSKIFLEKLGYYFSI